jgi:hypothetical protein
MALPVPVPSYMAARISPETKNGFN